MGCLMLVCRAWYQAVVAHSDFFTSIGINGDFYRGGLGYTHEESRLRARLMWSGRQPLDMRILCPDADPHEECLEVFDEGTRSQQLQPVHAVEECPKSLALYEAFDDLLKVAMGVDGRHCVRWKTLYILHSPTHDIRIHFRHPTPLLRALRLPRDNFRMPISAASFTRVYCRRLFRGYYERLRAPVWLYDTRTSPRSVSWHEGVFEEGDNPQQPTAQGVAPAEQSGAPSNRPLHGSGSYTLSSIINANVP